MNLFDYIKGLRKGKNAHHIEREAMKDPFLSDALDGYNSVGGDHAQKIVLLQQKIDAKSKRKTNQRISWLFAAGLLLCIGIGSLFFLSRNSHEELYSKLEEKTEVASELKKAPEPAMSKTPTLNEVTPVGKITPNTAPNFRSVKEALSIDTDKKDVPAVNDKDVSAEIAADEIKITESRDTEPLQTDHSTAFLNYNAELSKGGQFKRSELKAKSSSESEMYINKDVASNANVKSYSSFSLGARIIGKVTDTEGLPLPGVSVNQKNTFHGTVSNLDGIFTLENIDLKAPVLINYIGFEPVEISVDTSKILLIAMKEDRQQLDEVVVVGYGDKKRSTSTPSGKLETKSIKHVKPEPKIGMKAYKKYLSENVNTLTLGNCKNKIGKVKLQFHIDPKGRPYNIVVKKSLCLDADNEAIRLINQGSDWSGVGEVNIEVEFN